MLRQIPYPFVDATASIIPVKLPKIEQNTQNIIPGPW